MATRTRRPRTSPTWRSAVRKGTARHEARLAFLTSPVMMEILRDVNERLRPWGVEPLRLSGVRQPFRYAPRIVCPRVH